MARRPDITWRVVIQPMGLPIGLHILWWECNGNTNCCDCWQLSLPPFPCYQISRTIGSPTNIMSIMGQRINISDATCRGMQKQPLLQQWLTMLLQSAKEEMAPSHALQLPWVRSPAGQMAWPHMPDQSGMWVLSAAQPYTTHLACRTGCWALLHETEQWKHLYNIIHLLEKLSGFTWFSLSYLGHDCHYISAIMPQSLFWIELVENYKVKQSSQKIVQSLLHQPYT